MPATVVIGTKTPIGPRPRGRRYGKRMDRPSGRRARLLAEARAGHLGAVEPLLQILPAETNAYWKAAIINVLSPWSTEPKVEAPLRQNLSDSHALVRERPRALLDGSAEDQTAPTDGLRARLEDPVPRQPASRRLGRRAPTRI